MITMNTMRRSSKLIRPIVILGLFLSSTIRPAFADTPNFANCRLGAGGVQATVTGYDLEQLNMGVYLDWQARSSPPAGLPATVEYIQVVRVHQNKVGGWNSAYAVPASYSVYPNLSALAGWAANQPGMLWLIGNEIERRDWSTGAQDEITPELYATAFHEIQAAIKTADPTARIGVGGLIQATPLRLEYLDRVWASHLSQYGYSMGDDIDVWNIHGFVLREIRGEWGADIPAGLNVTNGFLSQSGLAYQDYVNAHYDMNYFREFIEAFRTWMAAHGERNKPLINSEYGPLLKPNTTAQMTGFLAATFDYMLTEMDAAIGFPADENRLIQQSVWYSVNDDVTNQPHFAGALFNSTTHQLTAAGAAWQTYASNPAKPVASEPQINLRVVNLKTDPNPIFVPEGGTGHTTLKVDIANSGNVKSTTGNNIIVKAWDGPPNNPGSQQIGSTQVLPDIPGCGGFITAEFEWSNVSLDQDRWYVEVASIAGETNGSDNIASSPIMVLEGDAFPLYLPMVLK